MAGTTKTRTQRRMEKRQAIILLVLVLAVSLASFTLGVIVGRRGAERDFTHRLNQSEKVLVTQAPAVTTVPITTTSQEGTVSVPAPGAVEEDTRLTFYDNVDKDTAPLGSGINLAPVEQKPVEETETKLPIDLPEQPIVIKQDKPLKPAVQVSKPKTVTKVSKVTAMPKVAPNGSLAIQIGSFNSAGDAITLKQKMLKKNYPAFFVEADLGKKGLWYRVRIGPYADSAQAKQVQAVLEKKEKVKGFISRQ